jgi:hypothetical protein
VQLSFKTFFLNFRRHLPFVVETFSITFSNTNNIQVLPFILLKKNVILSRSLRFLPRPLALRFKERIFIHFNAGSAGWNQRECRCPLLCSVYRDIAVKLLPRKKSFGMPE